MTIEILTLFVLTAIINYQERSAPRRVLVYDEVSGNQIGGY